MQLLYALATGIGVGLVFSWLRLPVPAPPTLGGVLGIVGLFLGYLLGQRLRP